MKNKYCVHTPKTSIISFSNIFFLHILIIIFKVLIDSQVDESQVQWLPAHFHFAGSFAVVNNHIVVLARSVLFDKQRNKIQTDEISSRSFNLPGAVHVTWVGLWIVWCLKSSLSLSHHTTA